MYRALKERKLVDKLMKERQEKEKEERMKRKAEQHASQVKAIVNEAFGKTEAASQTPRTKRFNYSSTSESHATQTSSADLAFSRHSRLLQSERYKADKMEEKHHAKKTVTRAVETEDELTNNPKLHLPRPGFGSASPQRPPLKVPPWDQAPSDQAIKRSNSFSQLSEARRARLEKLLERETSKPYVSIHANKKERAAQEGEGAFELEEKEESWDARDLIAEEQPNAMIETIIGEKPVFFNGSSVFHSNSQAAFTGALEEDLSTFAIEMWVLPVLDKRNERDVRTKRAGLSFDNSLLTRSKARSDWHYMVYKGRPLEEHANALNTQLEYRQSPRGPGGALKSQSLPGCTPTILFNAASGQLRVQVSVRDWYERSESEFSESLLQVAALAPLSVLTFDSVRHLPTATWTHVALVVSPAQATLFINGQKDSHTWPEIPTSRRIAYNKAPVYIGGCPTAVPDTADVSVRESFVGFMAGAKVARQVSNLEQFCFNFAESLAPPYPRAVDEWNELLKVPDSQLVSHHPSSIAAIGAANVNADKLKRDQQKDLRDSLAKQMEERRQESHRQSVERELDALQIEEDNRAVREEQARKRHTEMLAKERHRTALVADLESTFERRRLDAMEHLRQDIDILRGSQDTLPLARKRQLEYSREMRELAMAREREKQVQKQAENEMEKARLEASLLEFRRDQELEKLAKLKQQQQLRQDLLDQMEDRRKRQAYGQDVFLSEAERGINSGLLSLLSQDKSTRGPKIESADACNSCGTETNDQEHLAFSVLSQTDFKYILTKLCD